jgi:hypothetical protein
MGGRLRFYKMKPKFINAYMDVAERFSKLSIRLFSQDVLK